MPGASSCQAIEKPVVSVTSKRISDCCLGSLLFRKYPKKPLPTYWKTASTLAFPDRADESGLPTEGFLRCAV